MNVRKITTRISAFLTLILSIFLTVSSAQAQTIYQADWTGWATISQTNCVQLANQVFSVSRVPVYDARRWVVRGKTATLHIGIKCVADDNSNRLVNSGVKRVLVTVEVAGWDRSAQAVNRWRDCVQSYMERRSNCWQSSGGGNAIGRVWNESESGWTGVWTRRGSTNVFDAVWRLGNKTVRAVLTIQISGNSVTIDRRDTNGIVSCSYSGTLSADRTTVSGRYTCRNRQRVYSRNLPWRATIDQPVTDILGRYWNVDESGWKGVWTRRGNTDLFDAVWRNGPREVRATLRIRINGTSVAISRSGSTDGFNCSYSGTLAANRTNLTGKYSCSKDGRVAFRGYNWSATINR